MSSENEIWYNNSMKLLIPTAKEMNLDTPEKMGNPISNETQAVIDALASLSLEELASLYKISEERASEEEQRIQALKSSTAKYLSSFESLRRTHVSEYPPDRLDRSRRSLRKRTPLDHLSSLWGDSSPCYDCSPSFGLSNEAQGPGEILKDFLEG